MKHIITLPNTEELPSQYSQRLSKSYASKTSKKEKKDLGQFFTPEILSKYIASFSANSKRTVKILDPGCGTCILSCSLIERLSENKKLKVVELTTYEIDPSLNVYTASVLAYLNEWLSRKKIILKIDQRNLDFINDNITSIEFESKEKFDIIISNPPYFKISKTDQRKIIFRKLGGGQLNIYAVFVAISVNMLKVNGELIFIIPRSFASGEYFKIFRKILFSKIQIERIHLFVSRKDAFEKDKVLQENIIIKGQRVNKINEGKQIIISQSYGLKDIIASRIKEFPYNQLINLASDEKFLHLPNSEEQERIMRLIKLQPNTLNSLGYKVSTGPVVYFRKTIFLQKTRNLNSVPLFWLDNVSKFLIKHPMNGKSKEQYIENCTNSTSILIDNSNLVLVRRFSSKEDASRLVAAPHFKNVAPEFNMIGIENKLNYIVKKNGTLTTLEVLGICSILNSYIYDEYFKTFNGNTQVSASELKKIPFPNNQIIKKIGKSVLRLKENDSEKVNSIVSKALLKTANNG